MSSVRPCVLASWDATTHCLLPVRPCPWLCPILQVASCDSKALAAVQASACGWTRCSGLTGRRWSHLTGFPLIASRRRSTCAPCVQLWRQLRRPGGSEGQLARCIDVYACNLDSSGRSCGRVAWKRTYHSTESAHARQTWSRGPHVVCCSCPGAAGLNRFGVVCIARGSEHSPVEDAAAIGVGGPASAHCGRGLFVVALCDCLPLACQFCGSCCRFCFVGQTNSRPARSTQVICSSPSMKGEAARQLRRCSCSPARLPWSLCMVRR